MSDIWSADPPEDALGSQGEARALAAPTCWDFRTTVVELPPAHSGLARAKPCRRSDSSGNRRAPKSGRSTAPDALAMRNPLRSAGSSWLGSTAGPGRQPMSWTPGGVVGADDRCRVLGKGGGIVSASTVPRKASFCFVARQPASGAPFPRIHPLIHRYPLSMTAMAARQINRPMGIQMPRLK